MLPVCQFGVACPPWQLTLEHRSREELSKADEPVLALYVVTNATLPGDTRVGRVRS
jgi:hypothetical protein